MKTILVTDNFYVTLKDGRYLRPGTTAEVDDDYASELVEEGWVVVDEIESPEPARE